MTFSPLLFQTGDSIHVSVPGTAPLLLRVVQRKRQGYLLAPSDGTDPTTWSDEKLNEAYIKRHITHFPAHSEKLSEAAAQLLDRAWEAWPEEDRRAALQRLEYVRATDQLAPEYLRLEDAIKKASQIVFEKNAETWRQETLNFLYGRAALIAEKRHIGPKKHMKCDLASEPTQPHWSTVRRWHIRWRAGGRDVRTLLPYNHRKGNRLPRSPKNRSEKIDTYKLIAQAVEYFYLTMPIKTARYAFKEYEKLCKEHKIEPLSERTFRAFILKNYKEREIFEARYGARAAYLKYGLFCRRRPPDRPLQEVEIDHCLIDIMAWNPVTQKLLGRPWLTVIIDRATRAILGVHLSFECPSFASVQRTIAHAGLTP